MSNKKNVTPMPMSMLMATNWQSKWQQVEEQLAVNTQATDTIASSQGDFESSSEADENNNRFPVYSSSITLNTRKQSGATSGGFDSIALNLGDPALASVEKIPIVQQKTIEEEKNNGKKDS